MKTTLRLILVIFGLLVFSPVKSQTINMQNGNFDVIAGSFYDEGGINNLYNTNLGSTILTLNSNSTDSSGNYNRLQFNFSQFACGPGDTLFIYDGANVSAPLIGTYTLLNSPGVFESTTRSVTFKFTNDGIGDPYGLNSGWVAQFCPFYVSPICYNLSAATVAQTPNIITCNATLYDSGGPTGNYGLYENNTLVFTSGLNSHLVAYPQFFDVQSSCTLEIFDGNLNTNPNARRIGYFKNGFTPPPQIISSTNSLTFKFTSNYYGTPAPGFQFNIACLPDIFTADSSASGFPGISIGQFQVGSSTSDQNQIVYDCTQPLMLLQTSVNIPGVLTYDYTVDTIPYNPPFNYYGGSLTQVPTSQDDYWLGPKSLTPVGSLDTFSFSFYGFDYDACVPETNGAISFNDHPIGSSGWQYNTTIPNVLDPNFTFISGNNHKNTVFGVFQDTYPGAGSPPANSGVYYGHQGVYPNRVFVMSFYRLPQFSCTSDNLSTYQIVLYEGTNIIDVYVQERTVCGSWNNGSGLIGLLNIGGNQAVVPPGRNTGNWTSQNEAWRFTPITPVNYEIQWYTNSIDSTTKIATKGNSTNVMSISPTETTNYIVSVQTTRQDGTIYSFIDTIKVIVNTPEIGSEIFGPSTVSANQTYHYSASEANNYDTLIWSTDQPNFELLNQNGNGIDLMVNGPGSGVLKVFGQNNCGDSEELSLVINNTISVDNLVMDQIKIAPNPTNGNVNINFGSENSINKIEVFNYLGQLKFQQNVNSSSINLNMESFASGLYFIRFYDQTKCIGTKKIIKK